VGSFQFRTGAPAGDGTHQTGIGSQPALAPSLAGRLFGRLHYGLSALFGRETQDIQLWRDQLAGGRIEATPKGEQAPPVNFFSPEAAKSTFAGVTASLGYRHPRWGIGSLYVQYRHEDVKWNQSETRHLFELQEPRNLVGFGAAGVVNLEPKIQVGAAVGREYYSSREKYRFTLSGGSTDSPLTGRGDHSFHDHWAKYVRARMQADVPDVPLTLGAAVRVAFDRETQTAAQGHPSDFNDFVLESVAGDTIVAPGLVATGRTESRTLEFGGGASYRLMENRGTLGAEYRHFRDAVNGSLVFATSTGWEARAGGEYRFLPRWTGRLGYRHHREDADVNTPRNEAVADRASLGVEYSNLFRKWSLEAQAYREWWRTEYPDPRETGGPGMGFSLMATREF